MKKMLATAVALSLAGILSVAYAADGAAPGQQQKAQNMDKKAEKKAKKDQKKEKKQVHKTDKAATPAEPAKK